MTIFGFGDSFTEGLCSDSLFSKNTGKVKYTFLEYLNSFLDENYIVEKYSIPGASTTDIVSMYLNYASKIKKDDIVILQTTTPERTLIPAKRQYSKDSLIYNKPIDSKIDTLTSLTFVQATQKGILDLEYETIFANSLNYCEDKKSKEEISNIIKDFMFHIVINQWDIFDTYFSNMIKLCRKDAISKGARVVVLDHSIWFKLERVLEVKDLYCGCNHWNDNGHKLVAELLKKCLQNYIDTLTESNLKLTYQINEE